MTCFTIDYFVKDRYTPEPHDSTMAIPYTVTKAGPLFIVASIFLGIAILFASLGHVWRKKRVATFIAGIIFIISGLIMLIGIVVYLSVLQSEIGVKLRARNALDKPVFKYDYGYGFVLIVIGFMLTELTGICVIFWYIYWHQLDWAKKESQSNGNVVMRPLDKGFECDSNSYAYNPYLQSTNVGFNGFSYNNGSGHEHYNHLNNCSSNQHNHGHHHNRTHSDRDVDSRGFSRGSELNSYYTYSTGNHQRGDSILCKKHGQQFFDYNRQPHPSCCNCNSSKKYRPSSKSHHHSGSSGSHQYYHHYDDNVDDIDNILDVPFPPPPPSHRPIPRDITCTTTVSSDDFYGVTAQQQQSQQGGNSRDLRKTTPV